MEAVPRMPMLSFEIKQSLDYVEFGPTLKKYIRDHYGEDPALYNKACNDLESLRQSAVHVSHDFMGCSTLKKYFAQLQFLQGRFPMTEGGEAAVQFTWEDVHSGREVTLEDIKFEQACILYNIGALHSELGSMDTRQSADGMKVSCTHFQCAAWAFEHLRDHFGSGGMSLDMSHEILTFHINLMLAQAQECILEKSMTDSRKSTITAKVSSQIVEFYKISLKNLETCHSEDLISSKRYKDWKKRIEVKILFYSCITFFYQGRQSEDQQKWGECLAFYTVAQDKLTDCMKAAKSEVSDIQESLRFTMDVVGGKYQAAKKDNDFVYHEKIPAADTLPEVKGASLVKGIAFNPGDPEISGPDIFLKLVPMSAHEASSLYSEEKATLLRRICAEIAEKDEELTQYLSSLQLDQSRLNPEPERLPQQLLEKCAALSVRTNAIKDLVDSMGAVSNAATDVDLGLKEIQQLLEDEKTSEAEFQNNFGKRAPNIILSEMEKECAMFEEGHKKGSQSNNDLHKAMNTHISNLKCLSSPLGDLQQLLPSLDKDRAPENEDIIKELNRLLSKVEEMRGQRQTLEDQLRQDVHKDDITNVLCTREGGERTALFAEQIQKHDKVIGLIRQNLTAQANILRALTDSNARYASVRKATSDIITRRDQMIRDLINSYDVYEDLMAKSQKGLEFYKKLEANVTRLLSRCKGVVKVQQEERDQIMNRYKPKAPVPSRPIAAKPDPPEPASPQASSIPTMFEGPKLKDYLPFMKPKTFGKKDGSPPVSMDPQVAAYMSKTGGDGGSLPSSATMSPVHVTPGSSSHPGTPVAGRQPQYPEQSPSAPVDQTGRTGDLRHPSPSASPSSSGTHLSTSAVSSHPSQLPYPPRQSPLPTRPDAQLPPQVPRAQQPGGMSYIPSLSYSQAASMLQGPGSPRPSSSVPSSQTDQLPRQQSPLPPPSPQQQSRASAGVPSGHYQPVPGSQAGLQPGNQFSGSHLPQSQAGAIPSASGATGVQAQTLANQQQQQHYQQQQQVPQSPQPRQQYPPPQQSQQPAYPTSQHPTAVGQQSGLQYQAPQFHSQPTGYQPQGQVMTSQQQQQYQPGSSQQPRPVLHQPAQYPSSQNAPAPSLQQTAQGPGHLRGETNTVSTVHTPVFSPGNDGGAGAITHYHNQNSGQVSGQQPQPLPASQQPQMTQQLTAEGQLQYQQSVQLSSQQMGQSYQGVPGQQFSQPPQQLSQTLQQQTQQIPQHLGQPGQVSQLPQPGQMAQQLPQQPQPGQISQQLPQQQQPGQMTQQLPQQPQPGQISQQLPQQPQPGQISQQLPQQPQPGQISQQLPQQPQPGQITQQLPQQPQPGQISQQLPQQPQPGQISQQLPQQPQPGQILQQLPQQPQPGQISQQLPQQPQPGQMTQQLPQQPQPGQISQQLPQQPQPGQISQQLPQQPQPGQMTQQKQPGQISQQWPQQPQPGQISQQLPQQPQPGQMTQQLPQQPQPEQISQQMPQQPKPGQISQQLPQQPQPGQISQQMPQQPQPGQISQQLPQQPQPGQMTQQPGQISQQLPQQPQAGQISQQPQPGQISQQLPQQPQPGQISQQLPQQPQPGQISQQLNPGQISQQLQGGQLQPIQQPDPVALSQQHLYSQTVQHQACSQGQQVKQPVMVPPGQVLLSQAGQLPYTGQTAQPSAVGQLQQGTAVVGQQQQYGGQQLLGNQASGQQQYSQSAPTLQPQQQPQPPVGQPPQLQQYPGQLSQQPGQLQQQSGQLPVGQQAGQFMEQPQANVQGSQQYQPYQAVGISGPGQQALSQAYSATQTFHGNQTNQYTGPSMQQSTRQLGTGAGYQAVTSQVTGTNSMGQSFNRQGTSVSVQGTGYSVQGMVPVSQVAGIVAGSKGSAQPSQHHMNQPVYSSQQYSQHPAGQVPLQNSLPSQPMIRPPVPSYQDTVGKPVSPAMQQRAPAPGQTPPLGPTVQGLHGHHTQLPQGFSQQQSYSGPATLPQHSQSLSQGQVLPSQPGGQGQVVQPQNVGQGQVLPTQGQGQPFQPPVAMQGQQGPMLLPQKTLQPQTPSAQPESPWQQQSRSSQSPVPAPTPVVSQGQGQPVKKTQLEQDWLAAEPVMKAGQFPAFQQPSHTDVSSQAPRAGSQSPALTTPSQDSSLYGQTGRGLEGDVKPRASSVDSSPTHRVLSQAKQTLKKGISLPDGSQSDSSPAHGRLSGGKTAVERQSSTASSLDEILSSSPDGRADPRADIFLAPKVLTAQEIQQQKEDQMKNSSLRHQPKDPYKDKAKLDKFVQEVEKLAKFIEGMEKPSCSGPTPLDLVHKEVMEEQDRAGRKLSLAIARCYPMKNRDQDIMPYDDTRVLLTSLSDDYINASWINDLSSTCPKFIATQAPLGVTLVDYWLMVYEQGVEVLVALSADTETGKKFPVYWPREKGSLVHHGPINLTLQSVKEKPLWTERIIYITHAETKIGRTVVHLHYNGWPVSGFPDKVSHILQFITEVHSFYRQQRSLMKPIVVHCSNGISRTGMFILIYVGMQHINCGEGIISVAETAAKMVGQRRNVICKKDQLRFCFEAILYYAQDILAKQGILVHKASFGDRLPGPGEKTHIWEPTEDILFGSMSLTSLQSSVARLSAKSSESVTSQKSDSTTKADAMDAKPAEVTQPEVSVSREVTHSEGKPAGETTQPPVKQLGSTVCISESERTGTILPDVVQQSPGQSQDKLPSNSNQDNTADMDMLSDIGSPAKSLDGSVKSMSGSSSREQSPMRKPSTNSVNQEPASVSLTKLQDPHTFTMGSSDTNKKKKASKADFFNKDSEKAEGSSDGSDPLSSLDPFWSLK